METLIQDSEQVAYSARQWAKRLGKKDTTVLAWIKRGLRATNVAPPGARRKSWLIQESDMQHFLAGRTPEAAPPKPRSRRRSGPAWDQAKRYFDLPNTTPAHS